MLEPSILRKKLVRRADAHKGDFGHALLIGGSRGMTGAIAIAAMAAMRAGAGLVTAAVPDRCLDVVASFHPCLMTLSLPCDGYGRFTEEASIQLKRWNRTPTVLAIGPGLGHHSATESWVVDLYLNANEPMVLDADALNGLAASKMWPKPSSSPRILTPHPGEFHRLSGVSAANRNAQKTASKLMARDTQTIIVLKGKETYVTDGDREYLNSTGNPGMAVGGSGDCLTGFITALLCQGLDPWEASVFGVFLHGLAGDIALQTCGGPSVLATELIEYFPQALSKA